MINVAIVDDHKIFRDGVISILEDVDDIQIIWSTANTAETLKMLESQLPDVLLMDLTLGKESGITLTKLILEKFDSLKIMALSMHHEDTYIIKVLELGAKGYILKDAGSEEMIRAVRVVSAGDSYFSQKASEIILRNISGSAKAKVDKTETDLTKREIEILKLICEEYSNPEIAELLFISVRTVDTHRRNLLEKLGVRNTAGMVKYALRHGIVK